MAEGCDLESISLPGSTGAVSDLSAEVVENPIAGRASLQQSVGVHKLGRQWSP